MNIFNLALLASLFALSSGANAALVSRLGGLAYYDTEANLTWLADANYAGTSGYTDYYLTHPTTGEIFRFEGSGQMNWTEANEWAGQLNVVGVTGWRLSEAATTCTGIYDCDSEMSNLYYNVLGNSFLPNSPGIGNAGPFTNINAEYYWLNTEYTRDPVGIYEEAYTYSMYRGLQMPIIQLNGVRAWAVHDGDVGEVPLPAAAWLFGSALFGLSTIRRKQKS